MSHFVEIKVNFDQKYEKELVSALEKQFGEGTVEVHDEAKSLKLWNGQSASNESYYGKAGKCNLIIRRSTQEKKAGGYVASNDAGYERTEDGKYKAYIDEAGFSKALQGLVAQEYALQVSERKLKAEGYMTKRVEQNNGTVRLEARVWA